MFQQYGDRVGFLFVYIQEAHADDEWQMDVNIEDGVVFDQPTNFLDRREVAQQCSGELGLSMPGVVDGMDNAVDTAYAAWPERLYVVGADGRIAYAGQHGPWGFKPDEVEAWLDANVGSADGG